MGSNSLPGETISMRNELARSSPRLAFVRASPRLVISGDTGALATLTAEICGRCGVPLDPGTPIFRLGRRPEALCSRCAPSSRSSELALRGVRLSLPGAQHAPERLCETCRRGVVLVNDARWRRHCFCSERCEWRFYNRLAAARRAEARGPKVCPCGRPFTGTRRDARFCSRPVASAPTERATRSPCGPGGERRAAAVCATSPIATLMRSPGPGAPETVRVIDFRFIRLSCG